MNVTGDGGIASTNSARCYDAASQEVFLEQAGVTWGSLTVICFAIAMALLIRARRD